jgi:hypothetical protein
MSNIPPIPLDRNRLVRVDHSDSVGKIVVARDPTGGSALGIVIVISGAFITQGVGFLTGANAGSAYLDTGMGLPESYAINVTDLVSLTVDTPDPASFAGVRVLQALDVVVVDDGKLQRHAAVFSMSDAKVALFIDGPNAGENAGGSFIATLGKVGAQWKPAAGMSAPSGMA